LMRLSGCNSPISALRQVNMARLAKKLEAPALLKIDDLPASVMIC